MLISVQIYILIKTSGGFPARNILILYVYAYICTNIYLNKNY